MFLSFGYQRLPLGYRVQLDDSVDDSNPGQTGDAGFTSLVRLTDAATRREEKRQISLNRPLSHGRYTLYQTTARQLTHGVETSTLQAVYDPGRLFKYLGSLLICGGIAILIAMRAFAFNSAGPSPRRASAGPTASVSAPHDVLVAEHQQFTAGGESHPVPHR